MEQFKDNHVVVPLVELQLGYRGFNKFVHA